MSEFRVENPPEGYSQDWMRKLVRELELVLNPRRRMTAYKEIPIRHRSSAVPMFTAPYPCVVRRALLWSPYDVEVSPTLYTLFDVLRVRQQADAVGTKSVLGGRPFSTADGLKKWQWTSMVAVDEEQETATELVVLERGDTLIVKWDNVTGDEPPVIEGNPPTQDEYEIGAEELPEEAGALLTEVHIQIDLEAA